MSRVINFKVKKFDAVIVLNSEYGFNDNIISMYHNVFTQLGKVHLIIADGAFKCAKALELVPDVVIGDMDSIDWDEFEQYNYFHNGKIEFIKIDEQETNDFEKCLSYAQNNSFKNVLVLGLNGGLLEHTLNNWSVMSKFTKGINLCTYELDRYAFIVDGNTKIHLEDNETVSLIPQTYLKVKTDNLKWELDNEYLGLGYREGARNVVVKSPISIDLSSGSLLFFCDARLPYAP